VFLCKQKKTDNWVNFSLNKNTFVLEIGEGVEGQDVFFLVAGKTAQVSFW
jgi:hypothetical protein